jgi:hypothetical protein
MSLPFEGFTEYQALSGPLVTHYPAGQEELAQQVEQEMSAASKLLEQLLGQSTPRLELLVVAAEDWQYAPPDEMEAPPGPPSPTMLPYWTDVPDPPLLIVPIQMDEIIGEASAEKRSLLLYHELAHAFLEADPRPWPDESPLWADEWQFQFAAFWLFQQLHGRIEDITADLQRQFAEIFEPEADGKTPMTVRGFDWYEDTTPEDYLEYALLLEKFAVDLLNRYDSTILPRFLERYRQSETSLLSDEVTKLLAEVLGPGGEEWLENLVYF